MQKGLIALVLCTAVVIHMLQSHHAASPARITRSFVISLPRDHERLKQFKRVYYRSDIADVPLTVVQGVDGSRVSWEHYVAPDALAKLRNMVHTGYREDHPDLTPGAVGCYMSHLRAWDLVADSGHPYAFIFEDDAHVMPHALSAFNQARARIPPDWDIVLLGHLARGTEWCEGVMEVDFFLLNHAYVISARVARHLARILLPIRQQVDWAISDVIGKINLKVFALEPKVSVQNNSFATNIQSPLRRM